MGAEFGAEYGDKSGDFEASGAPDVNGVGGGMGERGGIGAKLSPGAEVGFVGVVDAGELCAAGSAAWLGAGFGACVEDGSAAAAGICISD